MASDIKNWFQINVFIIVGFGIAFTVLMPGDSGVLNDFEFDKPFWIPMRALLGDFDINHEMEYYRSANAWDRPTSFALPVLLMIYVFIATVILVNLLIAQMSARYEKVTALASETFLFNRMKLYKEYKDDRDAIPPPFNLIPLVLHLLQCFCNGCKR
eukprot:5862198-Prymnesium_polylepis.1